MPWLLTNVINTDRNTQEILHILRAADGTSRLDVLTRKVEAIERTLRRRSKKSSPQPDDDANDAE
jgi:hypothetical protein